jgi:hypothetical protein
MAKKKRSKVGISHPYRRASSPQLSVTTSAAKDRIQAALARAPSQPLRITSSALKERVRQAIGEPHVDLTINISRVYGGGDPPEAMLADILNYRDFINDGMSNPATGLKLSAVEPCKTLLDFEQKIEAWYKSKGWTVIQDKT